MSIVVNEEVMEYMTLIVQYYLTGKSIEKCSKKFKLTIDIVENILNEQDVLGLQICLDCNKLLNIDMFSKNRQYCKLCCSIRNRKRYLENSEYIKNKVKEYYENNKETKKLYNNEYYENNKDQIKQINRQYAIDNIERKKEREKELYNRKREQILEQHSIYGKSKAKYETYYKKLEGIEPNRKSEDGYLEVQCTLCKSWFIPTNNTASNRCNSLIGRTTGDCNFYCSDHCKESCPIYKVKIYRKDNKPKKLYTKKEYNIWKSEVKRRNKLEHNILQCEYCGNTVDSELDVHHINPQKTHSMSVLDPENGIVCCGSKSKNQCHFKYGHRDDCSISALITLSC